MLDASNLLEDLQIRRIIHWKVYSATCKASIASAYVFGGSLPGRPMYRFRIPLGSDWDWDVQKWHAAGASGRSPSGRFLNPMSLIQPHWPRRLDIDELLREERHIAAEIALRVSRAFGASAELWMNLQSAFSLPVAELKMTDALEEVRPLTKSPALDEADN